MSQPYKSGRQQNLNLGITSVTENRTVLQTIGKVGIGTTNAQNHSLFVVGTTNIIGDIRVGGASTFVGVGTFQDDLYVRNQLYVTNTSFISGTTIGQDIVTRNLTATGVSTLGVTSASSLTAQQINVSGLSTFSGNSTFQSSLSGTQANFSGVVTAYSFSGIGSNLTLLNASNLSSGTVPAERIAASFGDFTVGSNLYVNGTLSVGGTSVILNVATLQIKDKDIVIGIVTDAYGNDISDDNTANHGGVSIASTVGSPLVNIPLQAGINSSPPTYKQLMWVKQGNYAGWGTDSWLSNYPISIGTTVIQNNSRFTVGAGFTVYDTLLDATDIRARNINITGISSFTNILVNGTSTFVGVGTFQNDLYVGQNLYANALSIAGGSSVGADIETRNLKVTGISTLGISSFTDILVGGASTFVGVGTFQNDLYVGQNLYANALSIAGGSSVGADIETRNLKVTGISTLGISSFTDILVGGASTFVGVGTFQNDLYVGQNLYANVLSIAGGSSVGADIETRNLQVTGISTFVGFSTFSNNVSVAGSFDVNGNINFNGALFQNNQPFVASRWTAGDGTEIYRLSNVGIGTTNPTQNLDVNGSTRLRGGIYDNNDYAGGLNNVLSADGTGGWRWISVQGAGAGTINGITILDEGVVVGTSSSVTSINFVGNNVFATASGVGATVFISDTPTFSSLRVTGPSTLSTLGVSGVSTFFSNVGVGTTNPQYNLDVLGDINFGGSLYQNGSPFVASRWTVGTGSSIYRLSNVGVGTTNPRFILETGPVGYSGTSLWVNGDTNIAGNVYATAYFGSGVNLTDLIQTINLSKLEGLEIQNQGSVVGTGATFISLNFVGSNISATGIGSTAIITSSNNPTFSNLNVSPGITTVGFITASNLIVSSASTFNQVVINGTVSAGNTIGSDGQYLKSTGVGVTWASFPTLRTSQTFTTSLNQTTFNFVYNINFIDVYVNGVKLTTSEYTANNGTTVVLSTPSFDGDIVELISYNTVSGGSGGGGGSSTVILDDLLDVSLTSQVEGDSLVYSGTSWVNDYTVSATTTSTSQITLHSLSVSTYRSVEYMVQATRGINYHVTKVLAIHNGTSAYPTEYGTLYTNGSLGTFDVDVSGGNMRLRVTPTSSSSTTYKIKFIAIKV